MPYAPGIEYHGDQYIAQGISSFGRNIGEGISEWKKKHDELAQSLGESDTIVSRALQTGTMTPDKYIEYKAASAKQKEGIAAGIAKNQALDMADREFAEQKAYHQASLNNAMAIARMHYAHSGAGAAGMTPEQVQEAKDAAAKAHMIFAPTSKGSGQYLPMPGSGDSHTPGSTYRHPQTGDVLGIWESGDKLKLLHDPDAKQGMWDLLNDKDKKPDAKKDKGPPQPEGSFWDFLKYGPDMAPPGGFKPAPPQAAQQTQKPALSAQDQQALEWAQSNPDDPRAKAWLKSKGY